MKNLKKALVLVLAFAMVFGMFTINASAISFADDEDIVNTEAVEAMTQLGVINGYEDGTFLPDQIVTRAEMCKMICVALNGGTAPVYSDTTVFSDIQGHWANQYISYCFSKDIVSGDSGRGGTFRPDATVTGIEAAKMMLVALGYNPAITEFTGADWANNVSLAANDRSLFTNLGSLNVTAGLSRDNAAQLIYNGINAKMVKYENVLSTDASGQLTSSPRMVDDTTAGGVAKTIITNNYGATKYTAVLLANENGSFVGSKQDPGYTWIDVVGNGTMDAATELFKVSTSADLLGKTVTIYVKRTATKTSKFWTVAGIPVATSDNKVVTFTSSKSPSQSQTDFDDAMKAQGIAAYTAATVVENYGGNANSVVPGGTVASLAAAYALRSSASGVQVSYIDNNGDKDVDFISIVKLAAGKVATYSTTGDGYITVTALPGSNANVAPISGEKLANVVGSDTLAKNDIVTYYKMGTKWYVTKCTSATATVTSTEAPNALSGSTTYRGSNLVNMYDAAGAQNTVAKSVTLGKDCTFYFDANGYVVYTKAAAADAKYLVVLNSNDSSSVNMDMDPLRAKVLFQDGTYATISITKMSGTALTGTSLGTEIAELGAAAGSIYTYRDLADGTYDITPCAAGSTEYLTAITANKPALTTTAGASTANAKTIFVLANAAKTSASAYTGIAAVSTLTGLTDAIVFNDANGIAEVAFAVGGTGTTTAKYVYVLSKTANVSLDSNDNPVYTYKTLVNGVATDLVVTGGAAADAFTAAGLYRIDNAGTALAISSANKMTVAAKLTNVIVAPDAVSCANEVVKGMIVNSNGTTEVSALTYNDSTKVYVIDGTTVTESSVSEINVIAGSAANTSNILITRASTVESNANYNVAGVIYIVKGNYAAPATLTMTTTGLVPLGAVDLLTAAPAKITGVTVGDTIAMAGTCTGGGVTFAVTPVGSGAFVTPTFTLAADDLGIQQFAYTATDGTNTTTYYYYVELAA